MPATAGAPTVRGMRKFLLLPGAVAAAFGVAASPVWAASGCPASRCVPRTGTWTAPSPQKLTSPYGPTTLTMKVGYRRGGKTVKSKYGNTVTDFRVYLRYFCDNPSNPWVETGFVAAGPITLKRDGTAKLTVPPAFSQRPHTLSLKFKRTTFSGRLSGSAVSATGAVCSTSVSFSGKLKSK